MPEWKPIPRSSIITITLPDLSPDQALALLDILEDLHSKLWHVHGDALLELLRLRNEAANTELDGGDEDDLPF